MAKDGDKTISYKDGLIDFTSGSFAGGALVILGQPLDTIKVKMQAFPMVYKGMVDCFIKTVRRDGVKGLYAGTVPYFVANTAENSVLFAAYGGCKKVVAHVNELEDVKDLSPLEKATAGSLASIFSSFVLCPTELIKCKLQTIRELQSQNKIDINQKYTPWRLTISILRESGLPGLYRGLSSTICREMPGYFCFFGAYNLTRELMAKPGQHGSDDIGMFKTMLAGAISGIALWLAIFPIDVVKSRIQVQSLTESGLSVARRILQKEGFFSLYNGLKPTIIKTIPDTAMLFLVYEYSKKHLHQLFD